MLADLNEFQIAGCPVRVGGSSPEALQQLLLSQFMGNSPVYVLTDSNTRKHCYPVLQRHVPALSEAICLEAEAGEQNKTLQTCERIWMQMAESGGNRNSLLINLGGGVITDLGGFAASVFHRGMPFINIPTTLMAMVDASLGGKTGVDLHGLKNQIGLFANPAAILVWPGFLDTLPEREILSGAAEICKHALIADAGMWDKIVKGSKEPLLWKEYILPAIKIKTGIVSSDPLEQGSRRLLNFGHTLGHAIETWSLRNDAIPLTHGEAVAAGMVCETRISAQIAGLPAEEADTVTDFLIRRFGHYPMNEDAIASIARLSVYDKKNRNGKHLLSLLRSVGQAADGIPCEPRLIAESLRFYASYTQSFFY
ncbi:MAG TPA: 3-dehydroquinate synthase [Lentimicrobium sp.]|jgi:3-dehydroquinate synthase|nr:3-dehydroquinate synthase [Lentimicrobium sp.]